MTNQPTFWLAREMTIVGNYVLGETKMGRSSLGAYIGESYLDVDWAYILGLPALRKGQQVQVKRTANGFEVVKGGAK